MTRDYWCSFWVGDDYHEVRFTSTHRAGSKANKDDALHAIRYKKGLAMFYRAQIIDIWLDK